MRARYSHRVAPLLSRPALGAEMAPSFFSESFLQQVGLHAQVGIHPLQSSVLFLQSLHLAHHRGIHTAILRTPFVKTGSADAMLPAQLRHRNSAFRLAQHGHDLGFAKSALLHQNLLEHLAEKILLLNPLIRGEDYRSCSIFRTHSSSFFFSVELFAVTAHLRISPTSEIVSQSR